MKNLLQQILKALPEQDEASQAFKRVLTEFSDLTVLAGKALKLINKSYPEEVYIKIHGFIFDCLLNGREEFPLTLTDVHTISLLSQSTEKQVLEILDLLTKNKILNKQGKGKKVNWSIE